MFQTKKYKQQQQPTQITYTRQELSYKQDKIIVFMGKLQRISQLGTKNMARNEEENKNKQHDETKYISQNEKKNEKKAKKQHEPYYLKTGLNSRDTDNIGNKGQNNDLQNKNTILVYHRKMH